jgi:hypothetical protein
VLNAPAEPSGFSLQQFFSHSAPQLLCSGTECYQSASQLLYWTHPKFYQSDHSVPWTHSHSVLSATAAVLCPSYVFFSSCSSNLNLNRHEALRATAGKRGTGMSREANQRKL